MKFALKKIIWTFILLIIICLHANAQLIRNVNLNSYKYIVVDEIEGKHLGESRRFIVKNLEKSGYNVVNLSEPLKTYNDLPDDLKKNKNLGLYLAAEVKMGFSSFDVKITLLNSKDEVKLVRSGSSGSLLSTAIKDALSSVLSFNYKYDSSIVNTEIESNNQNNFNDEWRGNGTGFFISRKGYIATNFHVVNKAKFIEVEFISSDKKYKFNAEVIASDTQNDLSVIKIKDDNFEGISDLPYELKLQSSDIGSNVFTLGYPMALSLMGTDIKFTDGKISSKTGYKGDITTYQISTPIQPGNSGGPLFDEMGYLIGITSSTINRTLNMTENVNYAIKSNYLVNLIDVLPEKITLNNGNKLAGLTLTEQIKILSNFVVMIKVK